MTLKMPAEWAPHEAVWIGFPHLAEEWSGQIDTARRDVAAFANAVHDGGRGEAVRLVVNDERQADIAAALVESGVRILIQTLGDIWLRDTGPIRSEEHTSELQSLMRISYAVFFLKKKHNEHS